MRMILSSSVFALLVLVAGCGESRNSASVTGTITLGGQPAADLIVGADGAFAYDIS